MYGQTAKHLREALLKLDIGDATILPHEHYTVKSRLTVYVKLMTTEYAKRYNTYKPLYGTKFKTRKQEGGYKITRIQ